jgi:hypothetical protein
MYQPAILTVPEAAVYLHVHPGAKQRGGFENDRQNIGVLLQSMLLVGVLLAATGFIVFGLYPTPPYSNSSRQWDRLLTMALGLAGWVVLKCLDRASNH